MRSGRAPDHVVELLFLAVVTHVSVLGAVQRKASTVGGGAGDAREGGVCAWSWEVSYTADEGQTVFIQEWGVHRGSPQGIR